MIDCIERFPKDRERREHGLCIGRRHSLDPGKSGEEHCTLSATYADVVLGDRSGHSSEH